MNTKKSLIVFQGNKIRRVWNKDEWWFSVIDVINALDASSIPKRYWSDLKKKICDEGFEGYDKIVQLKLIAPDGKQRLTDCANTESMFRIIQSIPSPKAEPFKRWLAKVGYERVQEIEDPELAQKRMINIYRQKGYSDDWIGKRIRGITVRQDLTNEWNKRGVEGKDYAILTNEISKASFGMTPNEYKKFKGLDKETLRDHMTDLELIFTMLGEASTTEIERVREPNELEKHKEAAKDGGTVARTARKELEKKTKKKVITNQNYIEQRECEKRLGNKG